MQTIKELLRRKGSDVYSIESQATVYKAVEALEEHNIGALVVIDHGELVGVLSERDYVRKVELKGRQSRDARVAQIMTAPVACVTPEQTVEECMALMTDKRFRHLPVVDDGKLIGLISIGDLVKAIIAEQKFIIDQLEHYIAG